MITTFEWGDIFAIPETKAAIDAQEARAREGLPQTFLLPYTYNSLQIFKVNTT